MSKLNHAKDGYVRPVVTTQYCETEGCFLSISDIYSLVQTDEYIQSQDPEGDGILEF